MTSSQIFSSFGIQLVAKWQFCKTTHVPFLIATSIILAAIGPCNKNQASFYSIQVAKSPHVHGGNLTDNKWIVVCLAKNQVLIYIADSIAALW